MTPAECRALVADLAALQAHYARRRAAAEAAARKPEPLAKARPPARPIARRSAPPVAKPAPRRPTVPAKATVPADWLDQIRANQRAVEDDIFRTKLRAASAQVARGEVTAHEAARLDAITHRAAQMGIL